MFSQFSVIEKTVVLACLMLITMFMMANMADIFWDFKDLVDNRYHSFEK